MTQAIASPSTERGAMSLQVTDVRVTYPRRRRQPALEALRGVSLTVQAGQWVALLGPNGSGKSTLMKVMAGVMPADEGRVAIFDAASPAQARSLLSVVFQSPGLDRHLTVEENLRDQAVLYGLSRAEAQARIEAELRRADLLDRRASLVKTLSSGLARRADLCRAMLHRPRLLLLDEPTVGLDPAAREAFLAGLEQRRQEEQLTIVMSTHLVDEADRSQRVVLMHRGQIVADDSPGSLRQGLGAWRVTVAGDDRPPPVVEGLHWRRSGGSWWAPMHGEAARSREVAAALGAAGLAFSMAPPTLADVFEAMTGTPLHRGGAADAEQPS